MMPLGGIGWKDGEMIWPRGRLLECGQNLKWRWLGEGRIQSRRLMVQSRRLMAQSSRLVLQSSRLMPVQRVEQSTAYTAQSTGSSPESLSSRLMPGTSRLIECWKLQNVSWTDWNSLVTTCRPGLLILLVFQTNMDLYWMSYR